MKYLYFCALCLDISVVLPHVCYKQYLSYHTVTGACLRKRIRATHKKKVVLTLNSEFHSSDFNLTILTLKSEFWLELTLILLTSSPTSRWCIATTATFLRLFCDKGTVTMRVEPRTLASNRWSMWSWPRTTWITWGSRPSWRPAARGPPQPCSENPARRQRERRRQRVNRRNK